MEASILKSVKKLLGISEELTAFDPDIIMHINSVLSVLHQLGVGPDEGFFIEDDGPEWTDLLGPTPYLNLVVSYVVLRVRMLFDPPTTSFLLTNMNEQIEQFEWRITHEVDWRKNPVDPMSIVEVTDDGV